MPGGGRRLAVKPAATGDGELKFDQIRPGGLFGDRMFTTPEWIGDYPCDAF